MTTIAISALPLAANATTADILPIVQAGTTKQLTNAQLFDRLNATNAAAPTIASATTIAPVKQITFILGTAAIETITAPSSILLSGGTIILIPLAAFTWTTAGNIAVAGTAVANRMLTLAYDATTTKWYPSYV